MLLYTLDCCSPRTVNSRMARLVKSTILVLFPAAIRYSTVSLWFKKLQRRLLSLVCVGKLYVYNLDFSFSINDHSK